MTLNLLAAQGYPAPEEIAVTIDIGYATTTFEVPADASSDWKALVVHPHPSGNRRGAFLFPVEGKRSMVALTGRHEDKPSNKESEFFDHVRSLPIPTVYNALIGAKRCSDITCFGLKASRWRRFERNFALPDNLIPIADAICRFNPVYGQGMTVAAQQACVLQNVLSSAASNGNIEDVSQQFIKEAQNTIEAPWATAVIPDFLDERTKGERPPDLDKALKFSAALFKKASEDPAVHKVLLEVQNLLKPRSALRELPIEC